VNILIADDDAISRRILEVTLQKSGYEVTVAVDGAQAWEILQRESAPPFAILDWMMPYVDGPELCRRVRANPRTPPPYLIILTTRESRGDVVKGLEAGADDYITKPFDSDELRARVSVGVRIVDLQLKLSGRVRELEEVLKNVKQLQGLLPICCYCKKIRDDGRYWRQVESYLAEHADVQFSHAICPDCYKSIVEPELEKLPPVARQEDGGS
jgi:sigma-B regulation protein RsbU (phosphoserine phosphatase)